MDWEKNITLGIFLILFGWWINPVIQEARNKQSCIDITRKEFVAGQKNEEYGYDTDYQYLNEKEEAFMAAYIKCNRLIN